MLVLSPFWVGPRWGVSGRWLLAGLLAELAFGWQEDLTLKLF